MLISVLVSLLSAPVPLVPAANDTPLEPTATEHPVDSTVDEDVGQRGAFVGFGNTEPGTSADVFEPSSAEYFELVDSDHDGYLDAEEIATLPWDEGDAPDSAELKAFLDWYDESLTDVLAVDDSASLEDAVKYAGAEHSLAPEEKRGFGRIRPGPGRFGSRIGFFGGRRPIIVGRRRPIGGAGLGMLGLGAGMVAGSAMASNQGGAYNYYGAPEQQGPEAPCYSVYHRQVPCDGA